MKYTKNDVEAVMEIADSILEGYLKERGWVEDPKYYDWSKGKSNKLTNEEAFWEESRYEE